MATQVFADEELERLRGFPEIGRDELFRFFTLTIDVGVASTAGVVSHASRVVPISGSCTNSRSKSARIGPVNR
ncbi:hypothetical protein ACWDOR_18925 [Streptosporangium canum]|uniref:hypothetical protein n=1 Tax=Streptosporangium canum TaxID=324952 RepID=UPI0036C5323F